MLKQQSSFLARLFFYFSQGKHCKNNRARLVLVMNEHVQYDFAFNSYFARRVAEHYAARLNFPERWPPIFRMQ